MYWLWAGEYLTAETLCLRTYQGKSTQRRTKDATTRHERPFGSRLSAYDNKFFDTLPVTMLEQIFRDGSEQS